MRKRTHQPVRDDGQTAEHRGHAHDHDHTKHGEPMEMAYPEHPELSTHQAHAVLAWARGLWIRRVLVRAQEGQLEASASICGVGPFSYLRCCYRCPSAPTARRTHRSRPLGFSFCAFLGQLHQPSADLRHLGSQIGIALPPQLDEAGVGISSLPELASLFVQLP
jgi:hypothetical protein